MRKQLEDRKSYTVCYRFTPQVIKDLEYLTKVLHKSRSEIVRALITNAAVQQKRKRRSR